MPCAGKVSAVKLGELPDILSALPHLETTAAKSDLLGRRIAAKLGAAIMPSCFFLSAPLLGTFFVYFEIS